MPLGEFRIIKPTFPRVSVKIFLYVLPVLIDNRAAMLPDRMIEVRNEWNISFVDDTYQWKSGQHFIQYNLYIFIYILVSSLHIVAALVRKQTKYRSSTSPSSSSSCCALSINTEYTEYAENANMTDRRRNDIRGRHRRRRPSWELRRWQR